MDVEYSQRGFKRMKPVPSNYGGEVRVYESSNASGPHIWLAVECPANLNEPNGPTVEAHAHITIEDAKVLAEQLAWLADNHYQVEWDREDAQAADASQ